MTFKSLVIVILLLNISGCAWFSQEEDENKGIMTEKDFYEKIQESLNSNNWSVAISNLQLLESQFPFGKMQNRDSLNLFLLITKAVILNQALQPQIGLFDSIHNIKTSIMLFMLRVCHKYLKVKGSSITICQLTQV